MLIPAVVLENYFLHGHDVRPINIHSWLMTSSYYEDIELLIFAMFIKQQHDKYKNSNNSDKTKYDIKDLKHLIRHLVNVLLNVKFKFTFF